MSITSTAESVELKSMEMDDLRYELVTELVKNQLEYSLESMTDDELILKVKRNPIFQTILTVERYRHRPLEVMVEVDYSKAKQNSNVIRRRVSSQNNWLSNRWIWIFLLFGGFIISAITLLGDTLDQILTSFANQFTQIEIIIIVTIISAIIILLWIYLIPQLINQQKKRLKQYDETIMGIVKQKIKELNDKAVSTTVTRCWSCFKEIGTKKDCPHCGEQQK